MPRKRRFFIAGVPVHVVQRGNNREPIFFEDDDYRAYLNWMKEASEKYECSIHAYVLMTNHVHVLATPKKTDSISRMMQYLGQHYFPYINYQYGRSGTLWEGCYKASLVEDEKYLMSCMRYIEMNPVRAGMVKHPKYYPWSSYGCNAYGRKSEMITPHPRYLSLAKEAGLRRKAYRDLFQLDDLEQDNIAIRQAWQTGTPLGNNRFKEKVEKVLITKVGFAQRGRPKKLEEKVV